MKPDGKLNILLAVQATIQQTPFQFCGYKRQNNDTTWCPENLDCALSPQAYLHQKKHKKQQ